MDLHQFRADADVDPLAWNEHRFRSLASGTRQVPIEHEATHRNGTRPDHESFEQVCLRDESRHEGVDRLRVDLAGEPGLDDAAPVQQRDAVGQSP